MADIRIRHGEVSARISGGLQDSIRAAVRRVAGDALERIEQETDRLYEQAYDLMPVKTGRTRRALRSRVEIGADGSIVGKVIAPAHARYIQSFQIGTRTRTLNEGTVAHLKSRGVQDPVGKLRRAQQLARDLGKASRKAAKMGSVRWLLFGWTEREAGDRLTDEFGPLVEASLAAELEG